MKRIESVHQINISNHFCNAGMEYIEEGMNEAGTAPSFFCKLCDCNFTDVMGKTMHAKGRRHRLAFKVRQRLTAFLYLLLCLSVRFAITVRLQTSDWPVVSHIDCFSQCELVLLDVCCLCNLSDVTSV